MTLAECNFFDMYFYHLLPTQTVTLVATRQKSVVFVHTSIKLNCLSSTIIFINYIVVICGNIEKYVSCSYC